MKNMSTTAWAQQKAQTLVCDIMKQMAGIELYRQDVSHPEETIAQFGSVYGVTRGTYDMQMQFRASPELFYRLAKNMIGDEPEDDFEVREYAVEFFNVLCGRLASEFYEMTRGLTGFSPPRYEHPPHITNIAASESVETLYFSSDQQEYAMLIFTSIPSANIEEE